MGNEVQVITCFPNHPTGRIYSGYQAGRYMQESLDGITVHRHWTYVTPNRGFFKKTLGHLSYMPGTALISSRLVVTPDVAIGTSPTFFAAMAAAAFARRRKIPFIMEVRDLWPAIFVELGVIKNRPVIAGLERLEMRLYRQATKIVVVTEAFRTKLIGRGLAPEKVMTIPNGADIEFWIEREPSDHLRQKYNLENRFVVAYVGAHGMSHGLQRVLDSANELRGFPEIHFLFVGEGAQKAKLVERAKQLNLTNTTFLDPVGKQETRDFYQLADVCLVPLRNIKLFEAFIPSKLFEILSMSRPIIGSLRGEAADILDRSGAAVIVEPEDSRAIADAVLELYRQPSEVRRAMGQRGRDFVMANYSREVLAARYLDLMVEAIAEYRKR
jgi:glycosyltransferase involved in cell wall biosynthesis